MPPDTNAVRATIEGQGRRLTWVARQMGISPGYLTRLLDGERRWTPKLRAQVAMVLQVPKEVLFFASDYRQTTDVKSADSIQEAP